MGRFYRSFCRIQLKRMDGSFPGNNFFDCYLPLTGRIIECSPQNEFPRSIFQIKNFAVMRQFPAVRSLYMKG